MISEKSNRIAFLLCFFLGALGLHRLYVGKVGAGILLLIPATGFLGLLLKMGIPSTADTQALTTFFASLGAVWSSTLLIVMLLMLGMSSIWPVIDLGLIVAGKFQDRSGNVLKWK